MIFGVLRFPGSCDEVDAQLAAGRVGEARILWHQDRDLQVARWYAQRKQPGLAWLASPKGETERAGQPSKTSEALGKPRGEHRNAGHGSDGKTEADGTDEQRIDQKEHDDCDSKYAK